MRRLSLLVACLLGIASCGDRVVRLGTRAGGGDAGGGPAPADAAAPARADAGPPPPGPDAAPARSEARDPTCPDEPAPLAGSFWRPGAAQIFDVLVQDRALVVKAEGCCPRDGGGAIYRLELDDGTSRRARTFTRVLPGLAAAPGGVVFTAEDGLRRLTAAGEALLAPGTFDQVAAAPDRVFARTSDRVVQLLGLDGGATRLEPLVEGLFAGPIATDGEAVFFSTRAGDALGLEALWPRGGALRLATRADEGLIGPVAHRGHVYWHDRGAIMRIPSGGGGITSLGHVGFGVGGLAVDDRHLYFTSVGRPCNVADASAARRFGGALHRVPVGGGVVEDLQVDLVSPGAVALDDTHVYWTGGSNVTAETALFRAPK